MPEEMIDNDVFAEALKARKKLEGEVEAKKNFVPTDYENTQYCVLEKDKEVVFRPVGNHINYDTLKYKTPTDIRLFLHSQIVKDDSNGYINVNWPVVVKITKSGVKFIPDIDYILTKLYNKVYECEWVNYPKGQEQIRNGKKCTGEYHYFHKDTEIFKRIELNGKNGQINKFYPRIGIYMNVIDRMDDWCEKNKHTKLLISAMNYGEEKTDAAGNKVKPQYPAKGISKTAYDDIFDMLVKTSGGWNRDIVVKKTGEKLDTKYAVFDASDLRVQTGDISKEAFTLAKDSSMPADWEMYDLEVRTKPSSAFKLKKNIIGLFKLFDATFPGFNLTEELEEIAKIEQEEYNKKTAEQRSVEEQKSAQVSELKQEVKKEESKKEGVREEKPVETKQRTRTSSTNSEESIEDTCKKVFKSWNKLSDTDKKIMIDSIAKFDGTTPLYKNGCDASPCSEKNCFYEGTSIATNFPFDIKVCPVCGAEYS